MIIHMRHLIMINSAINDNKYIYIVYFDFKKAFNKVSHIQLLIKLKDIGIAGNILKWI